MCGGNQCSQAQNAIESSTDADNHSKTGETSWLQRAPPIMSDDIVFQNEVLNLQVVIAGSGEAPESTPNGDDGPEVTIHKATNQCW